MNYDWSDVVHLYYDWNDVDNTSLISIGDTVFAGDGEGGMKVKVIDLELKPTGVWIKFERLPDSEWIELPEHE